MSSTLEDADASSAVLALCRSSFVASGFLNLLLALQCLSAIGLQDLVVRQGESAKLTLDPN
jgi:hypothetical protein